MTRTAVVGPGRVGTALGLALEHAGYEVVAVAGQGQAGIDTFRARLPAAEARPVEEVGLDAELILLCVPDDTLAPVASRIAVADGVPEGSRWVHVAGGAGVGVLRPVAFAGGRVAACHPAQTFPDPDTGFAALPGTAWAVTAAARDLGWARVLVTDLRGSPVTVDEADRPLYHAGLVVGANATSVVVTLAREMLLGVGIGEPAAFLEPLATAAAGNAAWRGAAALTGPVRRGDAWMVQRHLDELRTSLPEAVDVYVTLARLALRYARRAGLDEEAARNVAAALDGEPEL